VPLGKHRVEITAFRPIADSSKAAMAEGGATEQYLPGKFNGQSVLTAIVTSETNSNPIDFDLKDS